MAMALQAAYREMNHFVEWSPGRQAVAVAAGLCLICVLGVFQGSQFIYFQF